MFWSGYVRALFSESVLKMVSKWSKRHYAFSVDLLADTRLSLETEKSITVTNALAEAQDTRNILSFDVAQGSVLVPVLFILYIQPLFELVID